MLRVWIGKRNLAVVINDELKFFGQVPQKEDLQIALLEARSIEGGEA